MNAELLLTIVIAALPVILAITLHEAAHGYAARHFGDPTAWQAGRITLNPLRHIDPIGTLLVPGVILATSYLVSGKALLFGWAKPVPVNFGRLRRPKADMLWVAAAGPLINLAQAVGWAALLKLALSMPNAAYSRSLAEMSLIGVNINLVLMTLNLLPLPPLDGGRIVVSLLPCRLAVPFARLERWGLPILLLLFFTHVLDGLLWPVVDGLKEWLIILFRLV